ncbi:hypothetical protein A3066_20520 [Salmonella enterica subsp. enterica serovar Derby]|uniref:Uncharacterized protein n=3 Tax=Enterobacteriaceae TaxID=543 RepID=A0A724FGP6_SALET|nr:hypothetical protein DOE58_24435 [Salmonella enterica subsp. enterica serovar Brandenburg]EAA4643999.1 hypothetical protein [Salmonella enterica subsp. enterica serovar London]EAA9686614.1 hypothetical protein [Salmonella enterica]EAB6879170.1 hypothetical protein [Salmonella enterica subsp. enterica serovar Infantis]EAF5686075.1 hypothetical protein [Salmonella enterica subsp. enterica serovar Derby]EAW1344780.1 hypothetical protein [Salmonella enterica subsp. enterica]ECA2925328.1 hypoth
MGIPLLSHEVRRWGRMSNEEYGKWWIDVEYISWGVPGKTRLMFESKEQALEVKEGYKFLT